MKSLNLPAAKLSAPSQPKVSIPSVKNVVATPGLTAPGGLTQAGGYMQRQIDIKSKPRFQQAAAPSGLVGGPPIDSLPKQLKR